MKKLVFIAVVSLFAFSSCDVDQTQEGEMPEVDVDVSEGQLPEFDVDWADVNVGTRTTTVKVPKVVVVMEEEEVEVPYIDVDMPNNSEKEELTIQVEAEVEGEAHQLEIQKIYATGNRLIVVSQLESTGTDIKDQKMRVSDQVVLNAPDLDIKHYIIGKRPNRNFNSQYTYIKDMSEIRQDLSSAKVIYQNS